MRGIFVLLEDFVSVLDGFETVCPYAYLQFIPRVQHHAYLVVYVTVETRESRANAYMTQRCLAAVADCTEAYSVRAENRMCCVLWAKPFQPV